MIGDGNRAFKDSKKTGRDHTDLSPSSKLTLSLYINTPEQWLYCVVLYKLSICYSSFWEISYLSHWQTLLSVPINYIFIHKILLLIANFA